MSATCDSWTQRWMRGDCYCDYGTYYADSFLQEELRWDDDVSSGHHGAAGGRCIRNGMDVWRGAYKVYSIIALSMFVGLLLWCSLRLKRLQACAARSSQQLVVHFFCLAATVLRLVYLIMEALMVHNQPGGEMWEKLLGISYSSFFPLSAAAFLCVCQFWLRLMYIMDDAYSCRWCRNRISIVWALFLGLEVVHDSWSVFGAQPWLDAIYFLWLALVDVNCAFFGWTIARGLYGRLRDLMRSASMADDSSQLFRRTLIATAAVSVTSVCFLVLSVVQALVGRFYAWPCLACFAVGRLLEAVYLALILIAIGRSRDVSRHSSNLGSTMRNSEGADASNRAFWISSGPQSSIHQERSGQWADGVLSSPTGPESFSTAASARR